MAASPRPRLRRPGRVTGVDTNLLVYAHRRDSPWHDQASRLVRGLAEGQTAWGIPWPCRVHGLRELWTADRDFGRFPDLRVRNPLVG